MRTALRYVGAPVWAVSAAVTIAAATASAVTEALPVRITTHRWRVPITGAITAANSVAPTAPTAAGPLRQYPPGLLRRGRIR
jgi:hypothetical protein